MTRRRRQWQPKLKRSEFTRGWVFFALYFFLLPFLMVGVRWVFDERLNWYLTDAAANALYYYFAIVMVLLTLWAFLRDSFSILLDWLPENILAVAVGLVGCAALTALVGLIPLPVPNPAAVIYPEQFRIAPGTTLVILLVLWPVIEEALFRGLLFGSLQRYSRPIAYGVSVLAFAFFKVWQFAFAPGNMDLRYLLVGIQYIPMGLALAWCYDEGQSIWSAAALHAMLNGIGLALLMR